MGRKTFFDVLERELDLQKEYVKIDSLILTTTNWYGQTFNSCIEYYFKNWKDKKNYLTFYELRETFGYTYECNRNCYKITGHINSNNDFFIYCEMILNIVQNVIPKEEYLYLEDTMKQILEIICYDLEVLNCKICTKSDGKLIIEQKDAAVTEVVDIVEPCLADSILEYNH